MTPKAIAGLSNGPDLITDCSFNVFAISATASLIASAASSPTA